MDGAEGAEEDMGFDFEDVSFLYLAVLLCFGAVFGVLSLQFIIWRGIVGVQFGLESVSVVSSSDNNLFSHAFLLLFYSLADLKLLLVPRQTREKKRFVTIL